jgi:hypothetical protein
MGVDRLVTGISDPLSVLREKDRTVELMFWLEEDQEYGFER